MADNSVFHTGTSTQGGTGPPGSGWDPAIAMGVITQLGGLIGSAIKAYGSTRNRGGGSGTRGQPIYLAQAITERYRPGPEPREEKSVWPSWGQILQQGEQANTATNREEARLAALRADGRKAMEAVSKLAQQRREGAIGQGIGVVTAPQNIPATSTKSQTFNLLHSPKVSKSGGIGGYLEDRNKIRHNKIIAVEEARNPLPLPKKRQARYRKNALEQIISGYSHHSGVDFVKYKSLPISNRRSPFSNKKALEAQMKKQRQAEFDKVLNTLPQNKIESFRRVMNDPTLQQPVISNEIPIVPTGVDILSNVKVARSHSMLDLDWFYQQVRNKGPWDFKQRDPKYQNFGNFHYGIVGSAQGIPEEVLLRAAGFAQHRAGTSRTGWGNPITSSPYGDDPVDQFWIKRGIEYYHKYYE